MTLTKVPRSTWLVESMTDSLSMCARLTVVRLHHESWYIGIKIMMLVILRLYLSAQEFSSVVTVCGLLRISIFCKQKQTDELVAKKSCTIFWMTHPGLYWESWTCIVGRTNKKKKKCCRITYFFSVHEIE